MVVAAALSPASSVRGYAPLSRGWDLVLCKVTHSLSFFHHLVSTFTRATILGLSECSIHHILSESDYLFLKEYFLSSELTKYNELRCQLANQKSILEKFYIKGKDTERMGELEKSHYFYFISRISSLTKPIPSNATYSDNNLKLLYMWYHMWCDMSKEEQKRMENELYESIIEDDLKYGEHREREVIDEETRIMSSLINGKGDEIGF